METGSTAQQGDPRILWALDLGNSRLKMGRFLDGRLLEVHIWPSKSQAEAQSWLLTQGAQRFALLNSGALASSWEHALKAVGSVYRYRYGKAIPFELAYETPETLGADRLAAAVGAHAIYPEKACMVIDAGTCITCEFLDGKGKYLGGHISPGLQMRLDAMHSYTAALPLVPLVLPKGRIGTSTTTALQNGAIRSAAYELEGWMAHFAMECGLDPFSLPVLLCGGDAALLRPLLPGHVAHTPHLVLKGLAQLEHYASQRSTL